jgi:hypothetical protein
MKRVFIMRDALKSLNRLFDQQTVFIVGGGKSLRGFDYERLSGRCVVGINQACAYIPDLSAIYWVDEDWAAKNDDTLNRHACKLRFCGKRSPAPNFEKDDSFRGIGGSQHLKVTGDYGFDDNVDHVRGNNSGSQVINLCVNMGATRIVLLGFDMRPGHWHTDYQTSMSYPPDVYYGFLESIQSMHEALNGRVELINCSMDSAIDFLPKVHIDEFLP